MGSTSSTALLTFAALNFAAYNSGFYVIAKQPATIIHSMILR
jgi:hypothetical protein